MKVKKFLCLLMLLIIFFIVLIMVFNSIKEKNKNEIKIDNSINEDKKNEIQYQKNASIEQIKNELGYTADSNLYRIDTEYDGRKVLNIKHELQFMVAFAGLIKTEDLKISDVEDIFNGNYPKKSGIWIEENNRKQIKEFINTNTNSKYIINKEGYLEIEEQKEQNDKDIVLEKIINSNKTIVLSINSFYYEIDNVTGEINKYPFEQLDEYQSLDMIKNDNNILIVLSSNRNNKLTDKQISDELFIVLNEIL